jgi:hypothetical protein
MRRHRLLLGALALLALAVLLLAPHVTRPAPAVTPQNFWRIRTGMIERDVEALLGRTGLADDEGPTWCMKRWHGNRCDIQVFFRKGEESPVVDGNLIITEGDMVRLDEQADGILERLRRLGGLPDRWEDVARLPEGDRLQVGNWDEPRPWIGDECVLVVRFFDGQVTDKVLH